MAYILPKNAYFGRVHNPRTYQVISRDIILRKACPFTVDYPVFTGNDYKVMPFNKYLGVNCKRHASASVEDVNVIGKEVLIGQNTRIVNSVIGDGCKIGNNCVIRNCIIWGQVEIKDGCKLSDDLILSGVTINENAKVESGAVIDRNCEVKSEVTVPQNTFVSHTSV